MGLILDIDSEFAETLQLFEKHMDGGDMSTTDEVMQILADTMVESLFENDFQYLRQNFDIQCQSVLRDTIWQFDAISSAAWEIILAFKNRYEYVYSEVLGDIESHRLRHGGFDARFERHFHRLLLY